MRKQLLLLCVFLALLVFGCVQTKGEPSSPQPKNNLGLTLQMPEQINVGEAFNGVYTVYSEKPSRFYLLVEGSKDGGLNRVIQTVVLNVSNSSVNSLNPFDVNETTGEFVSVDSFKSLGKYTFTVSAFDCASLEKAFKINDCFKIKYDEIKEIPPSVSASGSTAVILHERVDCNIDDNCFYEKLSTCSPAKVETDFSQVPKPESPIRFLLTIHGANGTNCIVNTFVLKYPLPENTTNSFEGAEMNCSVPQRDREKDSFILNFNPIAERVPNNIFWRCSGSYVDLLKGVTNSSR
ncbi:hypothetical protein HY991_01940 [Candidatus Micrarchaeota archaeon]|nr:hypothetical protein [Candidatus Micrarchaeota archaeon]